ncbi:hypothetical protein AB0C34_12905 [Nocardia sp. NPDC049220]|uniref:hypothetical protein n=1 Tax=Nocardia sp. NPDC049220 TaxID=3155273 RepID=UPI0033FF3520
MGSPAEVAARAIVAGICGHRGIADNVFGNDEDTLIGDRHHCGSADNALIAT